MNLKLVCNVKWNCKDMYLLKDCIGGLLKTKRWYHWSSLSHFLPITCGRLPRYLKFRKKIIKTAWNFTIWWKVLNKVNTYENKMVRMLLVVHNQCYSRHWSNRKILIIHKIWLLYQYQMMMLSIPKDRSHVINMVVIVSN